MQAVKLRLALERQGRDGVIRAKDTIGASDPAGRGQAAVPDTRDAQIREVDPGAP